MPASVATTAPHSQRPGKLCQTGFRGVEFLARHLREVFTAQRRLRAVGGDNGDQHRVNGLFARVVLIRFAARWRQELRFTLVTLLPHRVNVERRIPFRRSAPEFAEGVVEPVNIALARHHHRAQGMIDIAPPRQIDIVERANGGDHALRADVHAQSSTQPPEQEHIVQQLTAFIGIGVIFRAEVNAFDRFGHPLIPARSRLAVWNVRKPRPAFPA